MTTGVAWFTDFLGANTKLAVEIAWGADLLADEATWVWTEITDDVIEDPGINIRFGKGDEASAAQPASCTIRLRNESGDYSKGGESANWPNVRANTPVRVSVSPNGTGFQILFQGGSVGFSPDWPYHTAPAVELVCAGVLRRLTQGAPPLKSAYRRGTEDLSTLIGYWPCEEDPGAIAFYPHIIPGIATVGGLIWTGNETNPQTGVPTLASFNEFACSRPLPLFKGTNLVAGVPYYTAGSSLQFQMLGAFGQSLGTVDGTLVSLSLTGTAGYAALGYDNTGSGGLACYVYDQNQVLITSDGPHDYGLHNAPRTVRFHLDLFQSGANITVTYGVSRTDGTTQSNTFLVIGRTFVNCSFISLNAANLALDPGALDDVAFGHVLLRTDTTVLTSEIDLLQAHDGEVATDRIERLCDENDVIVTVPRASITMLGPQSVQSLVPLLREAEAADDGVLYDGHTTGLKYISRTERENREADLTLDATNSEVKFEFKPVDDDQRTRNKFTATLSRGGSALYEDTDGPMGTNEIGAYDSSATVNLDTVVNARHYAEWQVHLGTQEEYRYPTLTLNLADTPSIVDEVLDLIPGSRVDISNLDTALDSHPGNGPLSLAIEGGNHTLTAKTWITRLQCSTFDPWRVGTLVTDTESPAMFISSTAVAATSNTSVVASLPDDIQRDDLLIILASIRNSGTGTVNTPTGWTVMKTTGNFSMFGKVCGDVVDEADVTVAFTGGVANATCLAQMFAVTGTAAHRLGVTAAIHNTSAQLNASAQDILSPALTITEDDCLVIMSWWKQDDSTLVLTTGVAAFVDGPTDGSSTTGDDASMGADYLVQSAATNISAGTLTVTGGAAAISRAMVVALLPDPDAIPVERLDTSGSTLNGSISAGATSISVATTNAGTITYIGPIGAVAVGSNTSVVPALPTGWAAGDLLLIAAAIRNSGTGTVDTPAGWFNLVTTGNFTLLGQIAQSDSAAPTVTFTGGVLNATTQAQCFAFRGAHHSIGSVVAASATQLNGSTGNVAYPALTVPQDGCAVVVLGWKQDDWTSVAQLSGFTEISDSPTVTGDDAGLVIDYVIQTTLANISASSFAVTGGVNAISRAIVVAIKPHAGTIWTTDSLDYPMDLDVGGVRLTATACSDSVSPQTMTIDAAPVARTSGVPVQLWRPPVLGR